MPDDLHRRPAELAAREKRCRSRPARPGLSGRGCPPLKVNPAARERLASLLGEVTVPGTFCAQRTAPVDDLHLAVRGLGRLELPVTDEQARQLCRLGRPARYGRGEQTLLDRRVRDTWEIPKSRVKIDKRQWNKTLSPVLDGLRLDLGLPAGCVLKAELHSVLVYARGQFFLPHQDSEKTDAMVGSLVVTLPSSFKGGALLVEHAGQKATYRSSKRSLAFVAFYADCRHEVRPVTSGHRIVLTYNLLLRGEAAASPLAGARPETVDSVAECVEQHFTTPVPPPRYAAGIVAAGPPSRLVYLLDHEYTVSGLSWSRLKSGDAGRAAVLREAAARTDCDAVLALADIRETWSCPDPAWEGPWSTRRRYPGWGDGSHDAFDDDDAPFPEVGSTDEYELDELIDWDITLECWTGPSGEQAEPIATSVGDAEVCATAPSVQMRPYVSEYEGYMGNYGNTMERWYHRGAVVLWPRGRAFAVRAEASPRWALDELSGRVRSRDAAGAQEMAATLAPFWNTAHRDLPHALLTKALRVARGLDQPALATMLLMPFRTEMLAPGHMPALAALGEDYGEPWTRELLGAWSGRGRSPNLSWPASGGRSRLEWLASLVRLCEALDAAGRTGPSIARLLVEDSWAWLRETAEQRRLVVAPSHRDKALAELAPPILAVLEGTATIAAADLRDAVLAYFCVDDDVLLACLIEVLRGASALTRARRSQAGLDALAKHCAGRLEARLARPPRADDDWSIEVPRGCGCEVCNVLDGFLAGPGRRNFEWPLAKDGRRHVHNRLEGAELPVLHQTRRTGRPYTLVLTKTTEIHERERHARDRDEADLAWLHVHGA